jgi:trimeric autotransporter adhesin
MRNPTLLAGAALTGVLGLGPTASAQPCDRAWMPLRSPEPGITAPVHALATFDDALYAGGFFTNAGGIPANRVIKWDGHQWSALGVGVNNLVTAFAVFDDGAGPDLYVGGSFTQAGDMPVRRVARWDGKSWSVLGSATTGPNVGAVRALAVFDDGTGNALYAGGEFSTVGVIGSGRIAKWDGAAWSPVGGGMTGGNVFALAVHDDGTGSALYAAGSFTTAGGKPANRIAKWNGSQWSTLGQGIGDNEVFALASFNDGNGTALYAAGWFTIAGGDPVALIAKWDGEVWSSVGTGLNSDVRSLHVFDDGNGAALYAGGFFDTGGANRIARWDGQTWSPLGMGIDWDLGGVQHGSAVLAMTEFDDGRGPALLVAGEFHLAGDHAVQNIVSWECAEPSCRADFNADGMVNSQDFFDFVDAFFTGLPSADFNADALINSQDFFDFLAAFFNGC